MSLGKIVYVNRIPLDEHSGQATFERNLLQSIVHWASERRDPEVTVITPHTLSKPPIASGNINWRRPRLKKTLFGFLRYEWLAARSIRHALRATPKPVTLYARCSPLMLCLLWVRKKAGIKWVIRTGPLPYNLVHLKGETRWWIVQPSTWIFRKTLRKMDTVIVVTEEIAEWLLNFDPTLKGRIRVIPNGVPRAYLDHVSNLGDRTDPHGPYRIVFAGSIYPAQGLEVILDALARMRTDKEWRLEIAGEGPAVPALQARADSLGLTHRVNWHGWLEQQPLRDLLSRAHLCLQPDSPDSLRIKGSSSLKILEYVALEKWIMVGACRSLGFLGREGFGTLVPADDVDAWAQALRWAIETRPEPVLGRGRRYLTDHATFEITTSRYLEALNH